MASQLDFLPGVVEGHIEVAHVRLEGRPDVGDLRINQWDADQSESNGDDAESDRNKRCKVDRHFLRDKKMNLRRKNSELNFGLFCSLFIVNYFFSVFFSLFLNFFDSFFLAKIHKFLWT